jgi:hypothetical protein
LTGRATCAKVASGAEAGVLWGLDDDDSRIGAPQVGAVAICTRVNDDGLEEERRVSAPERVEATT